MRNHYKAVHGVDTLKYCDEIQIVIQNLMKKNFVEGCIVNDEFIPQEHNPMIHCNYALCSYMSDFDQSIKEHRRKQHQNLVDEIKIIGLFWATIRSRTQEFKRFPTIIEVLGEHNVLRCSKCKYVNHIQQNVKIHIDRTHKFEDNSNINIEEAFFTYQLYQDHN